MKNCLFLIVLLFAFGCDREDDSIFPETMSLTELVYSSATVQPDSLYDAFSSVSGIIEEIKVEEGQKVNNGQELVQIINSAPKLNAQNAKLSLDLARRNLEGSATILSGIEDEIRAARLQLKNDSINFFRQKNLWENNIGSKSEYDSKELKYELSKNNLNMLEIRYDRTQNELETAVQQARNTYNSSLINTEDFTVESKINGTVYAIHKNPGELVNTMEPLATLGSSSDFIIELLVDEVDIVKVKTGQIALISLDAYKDEVFEAEISKILPRKDLRNQTFTVEAIFNDPPEVLYPGLSGEGNIVIARKDKVLTIPRDYVTEGDSVQTSSGKRKIQIGLQNLNYVEVISGIDESTKILKPKR